MRPNLDMGKVLRATLLTLLAVTLNEILFGRLLNIPTPVAILAVVAYAAFVWGLHAGSSVPRLPPSTVCTSSDPPARC